MAKRMITAISRPIGIKGTRKMGKSIANFMRFNFCLFFSLVFASFWLLGKFHPYN